MTAANTAPIEPRTAVPIVRSAAVEAVVPSARYCGRPTTETVIDSAVVSAAASPAWSKIST